MLCPHGTMMMRSQYTQAGMCVVFCGWDNVMLRVFIIALRVETNVFDCIYCGGGLVVGVF